MMITGATGQGKSTQAPKLLLYSLKMIDNNIGGRVISTQPRINPAIGNAVRISKEMGVDIEKHDDLYYIQYKVGERIDVNKKEYEHQNNREPYHFKETTDGTLLDTLHTNPLMENSYDIVVID